MKCKTLLALFFVICFTNVFSQTSLPLNTIVSENFNAMGTGATASLPANWKMSSAGTGAAATWTSGTNITATSQAASSGSPSTGGAYNWATTAGTDRSVGFLTTSIYTSPNAIMAYYRNTTGASVSSVTLAYAIERYVVNTTAPSVDLYYSTNGTAWTIVSAASIGSADLPAAANSFTFATPKTINRTATISVALANNADIYFRWVFTTGNATAQGLGLDNVAVFAGAATPVVTATLQDLLQVDNGTPGQFNEGDVIRYKAVIKNTGTGNANNVQVTLPTPPTNTTMVAGSIKTSALAVDDNYNASFNTALNISTVATGVLNNDAGIPAPTAVISYGPAANAALYTPGAAGTTDAGGAITLNANGTFTYTPPSGFSGTDKFSYITGNGNLPNNDATVTINVAADISFTTTNADPTCNNGANGSITFNASGGNGVLQYSITGSGGTYQSSNIFTGLAAGTYNVAVKDAGGLIKTSTATLNNPLAIVVNGTTPVNIVYNTAMTTVTYTRTNGTGASTWSATGLPAGTSLNSSTGALTGTPTVTGIFNVTITATDVNGCTGSKSVVINAAPKLTGDSYTAVGNTQLVADGHSTPTTPFTTSATNILGNDASNAAITVTAVSNAATTAGGTITIDAAGKFTYSPPNGSTAADSYVYTATSNGVSATATISFTISNMIWYVNNTYAGANGTANGSSHRPYTDLTAASTAAQARQVIYVHTGSSTTGGNATLKASQTLRGAGNALTVGALTIAAGTRPTLSGTVTLANSVTADGFDMNTGSTNALISSGATSVTVNINSIITSAAASPVSLTNTTGSVTISGGTLTGGAGAVVNISGGTVGFTFGGSASQATAAQPLISISGGHATGTVLFQTGTLSATNGTGLQFDNADGTYNFNGTNTLNGGDAGIDILNGSSGTFSFSANSSITNPTNEVIKINASSATVTYSGTFSKSSAATGILVNGETGGTIAINGTGTKSLSTSTANAISLTSNTGATINFSGNNLILTTTSGNAFNATGGGTISVTGTGNTASSGTGAAINIQNTTISNSNVVFKSVSASGGANGIYLLATGNTGGLQVAGDGATWGSGGTIQNAAGADGLAAGNGIYLSNTYNVSLAFMQLNGHQNNAIYGTGVRGFTISKTRFTGANGTSNSGTYQESDIQLVDLGGAVSIKNCYLGGAAYHGLYIGNTTGTAPVVSSLQIDADTVATMQGSTADVRGNGILVLFMDGQLTSGTIQNCKIDTWWGTGIITQCKSTSSGTVSILNNSVVNTNGALAAAGGIEVSGGNLTYTISGNNIQKTDGTAISADKDQSNGPFQGTISNNIIGTSGVVNSGSAAGTGIFVSHAGPGLTAVKILNNTIRQINGSQAIWLLEGDDVGAGGSGTMLGTVTGNNIQESGGTVNSGRMGILITVGRTTGDTDIGCFDIGGAGALANSITNFNMDSPAASQNRLRVNQRFLTTARFPGYAGANNDNTALGNYLLSRNTASNYVNSNNVSAGGPGFTNTPGSAACQ